MQKPAPTSAPKEGYEVRTLVPGDVGVIEGAGRVFARVFAQSDPLTKCMGGTEEKLARFGLEGARAAAESGLSVVAIKRSTGEAVGFLFGFDYTREFPKAVAEAAGEAGLAEIMLMMDSFKTRFTPKPGEMVRGFGLGVDKAHSGNNLGRAMFYNFVQLVKGKGYKSLTYEAGTPVTISCARFFGMKEYERINLADWVSPTNGTRPFAGVVTTSYDHVSLVRVDLDSFWFKLITGAMWLTS